jgi:hypothetical protein
MRGMGTFVCTSRWHNRPFGSRRQVELMPCTGGPIINVRRILVRCPLRNGRSRVLGRAETGVGRHRWRGLADHECEAPCRLAASNVVLIEGALNGNFAILDEEFVNEGNFHRLRLPNGVQLNVFPDPIRHHTRWWSPLTHRASASPHCYRKACAFSQSNGAEVLCFLKKVVLE